MSKEQTFVDGMIVKSGKFNENAHLKLSIKVEDFAKFVKEHQDKGWLNLEVKTSKSGTVYAILDTWKPEKVTELEPETKDDLPF